MIRTRGLVMALGMAVLMAGCLIYISEGYEEWHEMDEAYPCVFDFECGVTERCVDTRCTDPEREAKPEERPRRHPGGCDSRSPGWDDDPSGWDDHCWDWEDWPGDDPGPGDGECGDDPADDEMCEPNSRCVFDNECPRGSVCINGQCRLTCDYDDDCARHESCQVGICLPSPWSGEECLYNADCGASAVCVNGHCLDRCASSDSCPEGEVCAAGVCRPDTRPAPQCRSSLDCEAGETCVDARCRNPCECDEECDAAETCDAGFCVPLHELDPECTSSTDCGGEPCVNGFCV